MTITALTAEQLAIQHELDQQYQHAVRQARALKTTGANGTQIGGDHYKQFSFETWDVIADWGLGYFDGNAVKYLSRWRHKNGVEDLRKARHYIDKLIEMETARGHQ